MTASTLLGHLAWFGGFSIQSELLCTQGLAYVLQSYPGARTALADAIAKLTGVDLPDGVTWHAEARQEDSGRPDLEARDAHGVPVVKVEAKLGAPLGPGQLRSYADDLARRAARGALLVLVPAHRTAEASATTAAALALPGAGPWPWGADRALGVAVLSWDHLFDVVGDGGGERCRAELEQLEAMYRVVSGDHIAPLSDVSDLRAWRTREGDFVALADRLTRDLTRHHKVYPFGTEPLEQTPEGLEPKGYRRRYVGFPLGEDHAFLCIGTRDPFAEWTTPLWLRFHHETPGFGWIRDRIDGSGITWVPSGADVWIPLVPPTQVSGEQMYAELLRQAEEVVRIAFPGP